MTAPGPPAGLWPALTTAATAVTSASGVEPSMTSATFSARLASRAPPPPGSETGDPVEAPSGTTLLAEARHFVEAVRRDRAVIDAAVTRATDGQALTAGELLALQTRVYRFGQQVDLATKVVEKSVGTVRRVIDLQV